jgi:hypothetical protein
LIPIVDGFVPFGNDGFLHQEEQLHEGIFALECTFCFSDRPELAVETFDDVGCVHDPPNLAIVLEIAAQARPILIHLVEYSLQPSLRRKNGRMS